MIELVRIGRKVLTNFHQMLAFIFVSQLFLASVILAGYVVPFPLVPQLSCASIFWLLWGLVPCLSVSMLATPSDRDCMQRTPRKNEAVDLAQDLPRLAGYFVVRHLPSVLACVLVFECLLGFSLQASHDGLQLEAADLDWLEFVLHNQMVLLRPRPPALQAAVHRAEAGMLLMIALCIVSSSCGYLHRCESLWTASPFRNGFWVGTAAGLLLLQVR